MKNTQNIFPPSAVIPNAVRKLALGKVGDQALLLGSFLTAFGMTALGGGLNGFFFQK